MSTALLSSSHHLLPRPLLPPPHSTSSQLSCAPSGMVVGPDGDAHGAPRVVSPDVISEIDAQLARGSLSPTTNQSPPPTAAVGAGASNATTDVAPASPRRANEEDHRTTSPAASPAAYGVVVKGQWRNATSTSPPPAMDNDDDDDTANGTEPLLRETNNDAFVASVLFPSDLTATSNDGSGAPTSAAGGNAAASPTSPPHHSDQAGADQGKSNSAAGWPGSSGAGQTADVSAVYVPPPHYKTWAYGATDAAAAALNRGGDDDTSAVGGGVAGTAAAPSAAAAETSSDAAVDAAAGVVGATPSKLQLRISNLDDETHQSPASAPSSPASGGADSAGVVRRKSKKGISKKAKSSFRKSTAL
jgi:hypothetical protein